MLVFINLGSSPASFQYKIKNKVFRRKIPVNAFVGYRNLINPGQIDNINSLRSQGVIVYNYQTDSFLVNGRGFQINSAGKNVDLNGDTLEFLFVNDLGQFGAGIKFLSSSTGAGLSVLNTLVTTGQFPTNNVPPLPVIGDNQSVMLWNTTSSGDYFAYYVIDYQNKNLVGPVDSGVPANSGWTVNDLLPLTNSGYFSFLRNVFTDDYILLFNDYSGGTIESYSGNSNSYNVDDLDGRWVYFNDYNNRVFKYFNGEEVFTINYTPEDSIVGYAGYWNKTSLPDYFYTETYHSGTTSYSFSGISSSGISHIKTYDENLDVDIYPYFAGDFVAITTFTGSSLSEVEFYTPQGTLLNSVNFLTASTLYAGSITVSGMNISAEALTASTTFNFTTSASTELAENTTTAVIDGNNIIVSYSGVQLTLDWFNAIQSQPNFNDLGISITDYDTGVILTDSTFSLVVDQSYQTSDYSDVEVNFYGDNKFFMLAYNGSDSSIPYTLVNFNGNTDELCVTTHNRVDYPNVSTYKNSLFAPVTVTENDNLCLAFYQQGFYYSGGMNSVLYCDFVMFDKDTNTFNTFVFQDSGVDNEKFCVINGASISKTFFIPVILDNTNVSILSLNSASPTPISGLTNLGTLEEIGGVFGGVLGSNLFVANHVLNEGDNFGTLIILDESGNILSSQPYSGIPGGGGGGRASTNTVYFTTDLEGWYAVSPFDFTPTEVYDISNMEDPYYISDYVYKGNIGLYSTGSNTGRILTPSGISSTYQEDASDVELSVGPYSALLTYVNNSTGLVNTKLIDLQGNTVNTLGTKGISYGFSALINQRAIVYTQNSTGEYALSYLSEGFSGTIALPSIITAGLAPNDFVWYDNI